MNKKIPISQVPFHIIVEGKNELYMGVKKAYLLLIGFFQELDEEIYVCLNFKDTEDKRMFLTNVSDSD